RHSGSLTRVHDAVDDVRDAALLLVDRFRLVVERLAMQREGLLEGTRQLALEDGGEGVQLVDLAVVDEVAAEQKQVDFTPADRADAALRHGARRRDQSSSGKRCPVAIGPVELAVARVELPREFDTPSGARTAMWRT